MELYIGDELIARIGNGEILYAEKFLVDNNCIVEIWLSGEGKLTNSYLHFSSDSKELSETNKKEELVDSSLHFSDENKNPLSTAKNTETKIETSAEPEDASEIQIYSDEEVLFSALSEQP